MNSRWMIHLEKGDDDKMIFKFGGQFYLPVRAFGWVAGIVLIILTGRYLF
ncbi:hypothetical protein JX580_01335 [Thiomicrospira microaerophila]|nr:hypothetical protein [Thiomicrospira microaerophila]UQB42567.1 hypothetical protein JX580_01335 [Thiomicrospira microaerophila]